MDRADLVLTDFKLPNMDGLQLLGLIRRQNAQVPVVVMTAYGSIETAVESMKAGATDFLPEALLARSPDAGDPQEKPVSLRACRR